MVDADSGSVFMYCDDGKWFCCSICEPLVDQKDHGALLERATDMYRELTKKPTTDGIILRLSQCHAIFFAHAGAAGYN